jgi:type I restriction enzyme S subunit
MAQLIYREWFVNFRFPDHENAQMVDSQLGKIPEGWRVHKLDELINLQKGKKPRNTYEVATTESMPYLLIEGLKNGNFSYTDDTKIRIAHKNDVIMVMDGASSGDVYIGFEGAVGSTLAYIRPRNKELLSPYVLFLFLKEKNAEIKANYIGAAIPHVNKDHLKDMEIVTPTKDLNNRFHKFISDIFAQIENLRIKNTNLRQTRDLLLPKLISGEINVGELEIISGGWENE